MSDSSLEKRTAPSIGLIGPYGGGNLGDVAIQEAAKQGLSRHGPSRFVAICDHPERASRTHGIEALSISAEPPPPPPERQTLYTRVRDRLLGIRRELAFYRRVYSTARGLDLIVFSGGGQFDDYWGGPWAHPYTMMVWAIGGWLARTPVAVASVGIDKLSPLSRFMLRRVASIAALVSFRDPGSLALAREWRISGRRGKVVPDLAFGLEAGGNATTKEARSDPPIVGVSPISEKSWKASHEDVYGDYIEALVAAVAEMVGRGWRVHVFVSQSDMDSPVANRIFESSLARLDDDFRASIFRKPTESLDDLCTNIAECDAVVGSRLHSVILSLVMRRPVIAISYLRKVRQLMADMELDRYCIDIDVVRSDSVLNAIERVFGEYGELSAVIDREVSDYEARVHEQFADLAGIASHSRLAAA